MGGREIEQELAALRASIAKRDETIRVLTMKIEAKNDELRQLRELLRRRRVTVKDDFKERADRDYAEAQALANEIARAIREDK